MNAKKRFSPLFKAAAALLLLTMLSSCFYGCNNDKKGFEEIEGYVASDEITEYVRMNITYTDENGDKQYGSLIVQLYPDTAPITVANFQNLVSEKFYDGLTFHRVYKGFMIQGGDPDGDGTGGSDKKITGEFSSNGIENHLSHTRGVISMARSNNPNSASSQFFIMHQTSPHLDGNYAAFGKVVYGMDTVDGIANTSVTYNRAGERSTPINRVTIVSMTFVSPAGEDATESTTNAIESTTKAPESTEAETQEPVLENPTFDAIEDFIDSDEITEYVRMNVTYTDKSGAKQTGSVVIRLYPDTAPITVANFQKLVSEKFYDGLTFHRVYKGFMIQGGDPDGDGTGGSNEKITGEFSSNGIENNLNHTRGVISMARSNNPNSASSQFFIMHQTSPHLDGDYAAFGKVVYGMDTVDGIADIAVKMNSFGEPSAPVHPVTIVSMTFVSPAEEESH